MARESRLEPLPLAQTPRRHSAVTGRGIAIGAILCAAMAALAPYNDFVVANTFLIGGYLPLFLVVAIFFLVVLVNAPLHRFAPALALGTGELATIVVMVLAASAIPTQGLMRYFLPMLVAPFHYGASNTRFWSVFKAAGVPRWLFPADAVAGGTNSPLVNDFYNRLQNGESAPYAQWLPPLAIWGIFFAAMLVCLVSLAILLRRQWALNERLPFPLAQLTASLLEPPPQGRFLNAMVGSRLFWGGLLAVFLMHALVGLHRYFPKEWPDLRLSYDFTRIMANEPWVRFHPAIKSARLYFTFLGLAYFIQSRTSFSLWASFLLVDLVNMQQKLVQNEIPPAAFQCQHVGAAIAFCAGFVWIGRHHWMRVLRSLFRRDGGKGQDGESLRLPALCALGGLAVMLGWMLFVGVTLWVAILVLGFLLLAHVVTARVVAETGLCFIRADTCPAYVLTALPPSSITSRDVFFSGVFTATGTIATRESALVFTQQGLVTADRLEVDAEAPRRLRRRLVLAIALALVISAVVSAGASLWCYYHYATPISANIHDATINPYGLADRPRIDFGDPMVQQADGRWPPKPFNVWTHLSIGFGVTTFLQALALRYQAWPLMPVGYLICTGWAMQTMWFSLFLGWGAKAIILKYGGARLYQNARPLFVGLIFGEALAAAFWLIVNLLLSQVGIDYYLLPLLPQ